MLDSSDSEIQFTLRFGEIALLKGFITMNELEEALAEQITADYSEDQSPRKLIGEILFDKGYITANQIEIVMEEILKNKGQPF